MNCCENCFKDFFIKSRIKKVGELGNCDFCNSKKVTCIDPRELEKYFIPVINIYTTNQTKLPDEEVDSKDGLFLWDKIYIKDKNDPRKWSNLRQTKENVFKDSLPAIGTGISDTRIMILQYCKLSLIKTMAK